MNNKITSAAEAVSLIKDGATVMIGGFMACGTPEILIDALVAQGTKDLTIICNDAGIPEKENGEPARGTAKLLKNGQIKHIIGSHMGLNPEVARRMNSKDEAERIKCTLIPQGTFAERIRCGGNGLGGFYTPTGVGTLVAEGKEVKTIEGRDYLFELPLHADFALIRGSIVDAFGNIKYNGTTRNFNPLMATAADHVICAAVDLVEFGEIDPNDIVTAGIFVDEVVAGEVSWTPKN